LVQWGRVGANHTGLSFFPVSCPIPPVPSGLLHFSINLLLTNLSNDLEHVCFSQTYFLLLNLSSSLIFLSASGSKGIIMQSVRTADIDLPIFLATIGYRPSLSSADY
ncbi:hypothetical protein, partial [Paenibacillus macerans]|uniref:hypothetical protein n=1 Tax=Paenibacillus macerans TaxID=44252 RepID=UPI0039F0D67A